MSQRSPYLHFRESKWEQPDLGVLAAADILLHGLPTKLPVRVPIQSVAGPLTPQPASWNAPTNPLSAQSLASSRLMPVRERLLQLRRRFHGRSEEVRAAKAAIERETLADAEAIVERLRSVEALKQVRGLRCCPCHVRCCCCCSFAFQS